jgi:hypothetical protein
MMDWVHVMRGPRQKGSKRKRRGKEKAHNNINGAGGPATPESPEKAPAAVAGDDSLESTDSPPAWVAPSPFLQAFAWSMRSSLALISEKGGMALGEELEAR